MDLQVEVKRLPQVTVGPITDYRPQRLHDPLRIHTAATVLNTIVIVVMTL